MGHLRFTIFVWLVLNSSILVADYQRNLKALIKKKVTVLLVRGFEPKPNSILGSGGQGDWDAVKRRFHAMGFDDVEISDSPPGSSISSGSRVVQGEIKGSRKPVFAVGHSVGALKILEALTLPGGAEENMAGALLLHCPFAGAMACETALDKLEPDKPFVELADQAYLEVPRAIQQAYLNFWDPLGFRRWNPWWVAAEDGWYVAGKAVKQSYEAVRESETDFWFEVLWGGDRRVIEEVKPTHRKAYMRRNTSVIRRMGTKFPIVSVIAYGGDPNARLKRKLSARGYPNDELVETLSQEYLYSEFGVGERFWYDIGHMDLVKHPWLYSSMWEETCRAALVSASLMLPRR